jgi:4-hydroxybenzoate polyprenyltransferase
VVIPFVIYPYTKRFTYLSHFILGLCLGLAPVGAWIAVTNSVNNIEPFLLGAAVLCWVAGFDIFYAIQDMNFDQKYRLYSIPANFGIRTSLVLTKLLHFTAISFLVWTGIRLDLGIFYFIGVFIAGVLLTYENSIIKPNDLSKLNVAFFTMNGVISVLMFCFVAMEVIFRRTNIV